MTREQHLAGLSRLDAALRQYDMHDPEQYAVVAEALRQPWPRVVANRARHQPPPPTREEKL